MGQSIDIFRLSGMKYPIHILAFTFSTVSLELNHSVLSLGGKETKIDLADESVNMGLELLLT